MCLEKKLDKEHDKTPYGEWAGYYDDIFRFGGDKFESKGGRYKYIIKDIDYSLTPNIVQMMYIDSKNTNDRETFTIKLPVLLSYIKNDIINMI